MPDANTIWTFREALTRAQIDVWADTAYRSKANEAHLAENGLRSRIHRKKTQGRPMPVNVSRANGARSKVRAAVEHVFARQKGPMGLVVRTIGIARATVKVGLANLVYNMHRAVGSPSVEPRWPETPSQTRSPLQQTQISQHRTLPVPAGPITPPQPPSRQGSWRCPIVLSHSSTPSLAENYFSRSSKSKKPA